MKTDIEYLTEVKEELAKKRSQNTSTLVTGFKASYWDEAAIFLALQKQREDLKSELKAKIEATKVNNSARNYGKTYNYCVDKVLEILNSL